MKINPVLAELGQYPIARIQERARTMRAAGERLVDFSIGDPREPTPAFVREALRRAVPEVSQYPTTRGLPALREAVAGYVQRRFGVEVDPERQIIPTTGSKEAIFSTPLAFCQPGDVVVCPSPGYPIYARGAALAGGRVHRVILGGDFVFRPDLVDAGIWERATMLWTCSPHNPAGSVMSRADIAGIYERCRDSDTLMCADECYVDLYEGDPPASLLEVAGPSLEGALVYLSLSKRSGMTGYRSAAVVGDAEAIDTLAALRSSTGTAPPEFTQAAAIAAWSDDDHVAERRRIFAAKRAVLRPVFEDLGFEVVGSEAGLYLWVRVGDDLEVTERLLGGGVVVSPGRAFGEGGEGFIRLALVPTVDECVTAGEVVRTCLSGS